MRQSVRDAFHTFSAPLEGKDVPFFYLDSAEPRAFVTIWLGNLCPLSLAVTLPMIHPDGSLATRSEIAAAWATVDARQDLAKHGGMVFGGLKGNELRLPPEAGAAMVDRKLSEVDADLARMFPDWAEWPACAQLALLSWAWAVGDHAKYPRMIQALRDRDFAAAAEECTVNPQRGTIVLRNECNRILLRNAQRVEAFHLDPDLLDWAHDLSVTDAPTLPALDNPASSPTMVVDPIVHADPASYFEDPPPDDVA